jgi:hypothetical protein
MVRPGGPVLCPENRERKAAREELDSHPNPLSDCPKCRERLRAVNRVDRVRPPVVNRLRQDPVERCGRRQRKAGSPSVQSPPGLDPLKQLVASNVIRKKRTREFGCLHPIRGVDSREWRRLFPRAREVVGADE